MTLQTKNQLPSPFLRAISYSINQRNNKKKILIKKVQNVLKNVRKNSLSSYD